MVAEISRRRTIAAAPLAVWDVLADFGAIAGWAPGVDHSCVLRTDPDGPLGTTRRVQVGRLTLVESITEFTPSRALAYDIAGLPRQLRHVSNRWTLQPANAGAGTDVTLTSTVDLGAGPLRTLAARVVCRVLAHSSDSMLAGLAQQWESTHV
ncbi:SRPBCC family protein [Mycobacterium sp. PS03-16]|uniref:SRPBCC family protein n=1 Tax=Mycobacterium sp. PS03-16 TaxID=2559611 RepID=UPI0010749B80|nr:SRPBCC family protein [Mycobacterium sp. PS03-16]TFV61573.1 SRPBCC family protein [Mycobacterium sp. PS03-16]